jgi:Flp pilus assembly protein TadB
VSGPAGPVPSLAAGLPQASEDVGRGSGVVFYTIIFSCMAVLLVVAGLTVMSRNRKQREAERHHETAAAHDQRQQRNAKRAQSRKARRKRN